MSDNKKKLKKVVKELRGASKMHASQADRIESLLKQKSPLLKKLSAGCKAAARRKFKVYPSAYANMWASRQQKKGKC
jgi:flagellar biosynthesis/type III secretory pathway chaperone